MARNIWKDGNDSAQMGLISIVGSMLDARDGRTILDPFTRMEIRKDISKYYRLKGRTRCKIV